MSDVFKSGARRRILGLADSAGAVAAGGAERQKNAAVLLLSLFACAIFCVADELNPSLGYFQAAWVKQVLLFSAMGAYAFLYRDSDLILRIFRPAGGLRAVRPGLLCGGAALLVILGGAALYSLLFDTSAIRAQIGAASKSSGNFLPVALYIVLVNTLLEEIFFRGFVFLTMLRNGHPAFAYVFSSLLFAAYHAYIFSTKFHPALTLLSMAGLALAGFLLDRMNARARNLYNGWIAHAMASVGLMLIGFYVYGYFGF